MLYNRGCNWLNPSHLCPSGTSVPYAYRVWVSCFVGRHNQTSTQGCCNKHLLIGWAKLIVQLMVTIYDSLYGSRSWLLEIIDLMKLYVQFSRILWACILYKLKSIMLQILSPIAQSMDDVIKLPPMSRRARVCRKGVVDADSSQYI